MQARDSLTLGISYTSKQVIAFDLMSKDKEHILYESFKVK